MGILLANTPQCQRVRFQNRYISVSVPTSSYNLHLSPQFFSFFYVLCTYFLKVYELHIKFDLFLFQHFPLAPMIIILNCIFLDAATTTNIFLLPHYPRICIYHYHHHHVVLEARISLTLSRHFSLSVIASSRSSGQHPVSSHSC